MSKFLQFFSLTTTLIVAILLTSCSTPSTPPADSTAAKPVAAASPAPAAPATTDEDLKGLLLKMGEEYDSLAKDLKAADSGKAAATVLRTHAPTLKALKARDKDNKLTAIAMSEEKSKQILGEDGYKKYTASVGSFYETMAAMDKYKDDPDWQAANKELDEAMK